MDDKDFKVIIAGSRNFNNYRVLEATRLNSINLIGKSTEKQLVEYEMGKWQK